MDFSANSMKYRIYNILGRAGHPAIEKKADYGGIEAQDEKYSTFRRLKNS